MHYLVEFKMEQLAMGDVEDRDDVYVSPEGDRAWAILEASDEDSLRRGLEDQGVEDIHPVLPAREYAAISRAREDLESQKARFVDDPSGALEEARRSVRQAMDARGYPGSPDEASQSQGEVLREYQETDTGDSGNLEDTRNAFNRLSGLLDRLART